MNSAVREYVSPERLDLASKLGLVALAFGIDETLPSSRSFSRPLNESTSFHWAVARTTR